MLELWHLKKDCWFSLSLLMTNVHLFSIYESIIKTKFKVFIRPQVSLANIFSFKLIKKKKDWHLTSSVLMKFSISYLNAGLCQLAAPVGGGIGLMGLGWVEPNLT